MQHRVTSATAPYESLPVQKSLALGFRGDFGSASVSRRYGMPVLAESHLMYCWVSFHHVDHGTLAAPPTLIVRLERRNTDGICVPSLCVVGRQEFRAMVRVNPTARQYLDL
jgi:hypothetical protein